MRRVLSCLTLLAASAALMPTGAAAQAVVVPRAILDAIVDDEPNPLPRSKTADELRLPSPVPPKHVTSAPSGPVRTAAEYNPNDGLLISWGSFSNLLTAMTVGITTGDPDAVVWIAVSGAPQQNNATSTLQNAGADMARVSFVHYDTNSPWMRDYGPRFISENGRRTMVDHTYNRATRPADNAYPDHLSALWDEPQHDIPLTHGGGNFHLFDSGEGFMSDLILEENPTLDEQQVKDYYRQYQNLDVTIYPSFPYAFDGTKHIDMWMLPAEDGSVIVGQYGASDGIPHTVTEGAVADLSARGHTVHRTPGWGVDGVHYTYTNSVVFNELVFMCTFSGYPAENAQAQSVFESAFPTKQIIPVDCSTIILYSGAIHCIVMHVPSADGELFSDGFGDGNLLAWSSSLS